MAASDPDPTPPFPLFKLFFVLLALAAMGHSAHSLLQPAGPADPRPEVNAFVAAVRSGVLTDADRAALAAYRASLQHQESRDALVHEVNYLLRRGGLPRRFGFDAAGRVVDLPPPPPEWDAPPEPSGPPPRDPDGPPGSGSAPRHLNAPAFNPAPAPAAVPPPPPSRAKSAGTDLPKKGA